MKKINNYPLNWGLLLLLLTTVATVQAQAQARNTAPLRVQVGKKRGAVSRTVVQHPNARVFRQQLGQFATALAATETPEPLASHTERGKINDIIATYSEGGTFHARSAFRRYMPTLSVMEVLFKDEEVAAALRDEYVASYGNYFKKEILDDFRHLDLNRTKVYRTTLGAITPDLLKPDLRDVNWPVLRAEFYYPYDRLAVIGTHPVLTIFFVRVENELKIFHLQALQSAQPTTR